MKKYDYIIIVVVTFMAALLFLIFPSEKGRVVKVSENNQTVYEGSLYTDKTVELKNNLLVIENGSVYMKNANCKNGICVHTGKISKKGESIICLPNRVIAKIE